MAIRIEKEENNWRVTGEGPTGERVNMWWAELDQAAYSALEFRSMLGVGPPQLGDGVPSDALERGLKLKQVYDHYRETNR
ncbi:MAG: hypothetical protein EOO73_11795 [Myxococcales bacterium]|nr:MAG: hypothetical protein EOO73_11795 [Myxococcales bacterium]